MVRVIEGLESTGELSDAIQKVIDEIMVPLADNVKVTYVDETFMPDEISVEFSWEYEPGNEEYIGTWEIEMNKDNVANYSNYLSDISAEVQAAYADIDDSEV